MPYYSSAELVGAMAFRGIYTQPDLVIIHTGGNDIEPFLSPYDYKPDYSHWRIAEHGRFNYLNKNDIFNILWRIPSWSVRLLSTLYLKPEGFMMATTGKQITNALEALLANNNIDQRKAIGLEKNLISLIALSKAHGAKVVTVLFNSRLDNFHHLIPSIKKDKILEKRVKSRVKFAMSVSNETIIKVSNSMNVPIIPFDQFEPSSPDCWVDQCHLNNQGCHDKAVYIGNWLIAHKILGTIQKGSN